MITHIRLRQFRNYIDSDFSFDQKLVIITGPNASGKTNLLESIYVSSLTKSFKVKDKNLIYHGKDFYNIDRQDDTLDINLSYINNIAKRQKSLKINNTKAPLYSLVGRSPIVLFEPSHLDVLIGSPGLRRDYLDTILSQTDRLYLDNLKKYKKAIIQKNSLLKKAKKITVPNLKDQLFVFNIQLVEPSIYIYTQRSKLLNNLLGDVVKYYNLISNEKHNIDIIYKPLAINKDELVSHLESAITQDISAGFSTVGPHRDDFSVKFKNAKLAEVASRGEIRSLVLAFKLAEIKYLTTEIKHRPILLLDDVLSELDESRQNFLLSNINAEQTFITTTHLPSSMKLKHQRIELPL